MTTSTPAQKSPRAAAGAWLLVAIPPLTGAVVVVRLREAEPASQEFYALVAQIIAALFIALAVEFFGRDRLLWESKRDQRMLLALIFISWCGMFACCRAILLGGSSWLGGAAVAGLTGATVLTSLQLVARLAVIGRRERPFHLTKGAVVGAFLLPAILFFAWF